MRRPVLALLCCSALGACNEAPKSQPQADVPSPNASILPAPLESVLDPPLSKASIVDAGRALDAGVDAGPFAPETFRDDQIPRPDVPQREAPSLELAAEFRWLDLPPFPRLPETNLEATQRLRDALAFSLSIELSSIGRLRTVIDSDAFVLPKGTELRARDDHHGHVLVFNAGESYAPLAPGSLRALLSEGRADAAPLTKPKIVAQGAGNLLGLTTNKREVSTALGRLLIEQANLPLAGTGGLLLCRMLTELITADPANAACVRGELPLRAELFSSGGGHLLFEVKKLQHDTEADPLSLLVPPPEARFVWGELPAQATAIVPGQERLRELRVRPTPRTEKPDSSAPKQGLLVQNRSESLRYVLLDGVVLARVLPRAEVHVDGLLAGKYAVASLDFLGDDPTPLRIVELPARVALGELVEVER